AICHYTGPYDQCPPAYQELAQFVKDQGYEAGTVAYEWYLNGPETPPQDLKTDIVFPVKRVSEPTKA
ncbi:MAG: GyrI-like domain-containing protein, partial [Anaerolineae bacterium]|nr:GyrI-like domain-containing protein [Anaerolineae bacterium]